MNENAGRPARARLGFAALLGTVVLVVGAKSVTGAGTPPSALAVAPAPTATGFASGSDSASGSGTGTSSGAGTSAGSGSTGATTTRTVTGDAVDTRYGPVQVQVVLTDQRITDVVTVQVPDRKRRDREINARAVPVLRQEVLDAQSAEIDVISGASYTSYGYAQSVQSALDAAGV